MLLAATVAALIWANSPFGHVYEALWQAPVTLRVGEFSIDLDLRHWINDGPMALFFFVIGLELSQELTHGRLRDRRAVAVPALGALGGMVAPAGIYLAINLGGPGQAGWGVPIATDTAFALGLLYVLGPRCPDPVRLFLLTFAVVDDIGAILVIAAAYTRDLAVYPTLIAIGLFGVVVLVRRLRVRRDAVYVILGISIWVATLKSGFHPTVVGIAMGVLAPAYAPTDKQVQRTADLVEDFTRNPTPDRARSIALASQGALSPNERLQLLLHPWTSYVVLPLFALANAGVPLDLASLARAISSPITWGVIAGLAVGKLAGICLGSWLGLRFGTLPGNLVWGQLTGGAAVGGVGFTLSLFIAELAFAERTLIAEAKVGILAGSLLAATIGWAIFRLAWNRGAPCAPSTERDRTLDHA